MGGVRYIYVYSRFTYSRVLMVKLVCVFGASLLGAGRQCVRPHFGQKVRLLPQLSFSRSAYPKMSRHLFTCLRNSGDRLASVLECELCTYDKTPHALAQGQPENR